MTFPQPIPKFTTRVSDGIRYSWTCGESNDFEHAHNIRCLWVWHDCTQPLGEGTIAPGTPFGWRPTGVGLHTLVQVEPLVPFAIQV